MSTLKPISDLSDYYRIIAIWEDISSIVPLQRVLFLEAQAIQRVKNGLEGKPYSKALFYWSGGKDSLALEGVLRSIPEIRGYFFMESEDFVFSSMAQWYKVNTPERVFTDNGGWSYQTIKEKPSLLFPPDQKTYSVWDKNKWKFQNNYRKENDIEVILTGRRLKDGNFCGKNGVMKAKGYYTINPLYDWTCEEVFAYMKYKGLDLPPCYYLHEKGFVYGTAPWAKVKFNSKQEGWDWLASVDKKAYDKASKIITGETNDCFKT